MSEQQLTPGDAKRSRKPYTLTKQRESWSSDEHARFVQSLELFNRDWKKIEAYVGTKTVVQIRSHAQKYFQKVQKTGGPCPIPPPRPKRPKPDEKSRDGPSSPQDNVGSDGNVKQRYDAESMDEQSSEYPGSSESAPNPHLVYMYLGSLFDPKLNDANHTGALDRMQMQDRQAILSLMNSMIQLLGDSPLGFSSNIGASEDNSQGGSTNGGSNSENLDDELQDTPADSMHDLSGGNSQGMGLQDPSDSGLSLSAAGR